MQNALTPDDPQWTCTPGAAPRPYSNPGETNPGTWMQVAVNVYGHDLHGYFTSHITRSRCNPGTEGTNCWGLDFPSGNYDFYPEVEFSATITWEPHETEGCDVDQDGCCKMQGSFSKFMVGTNAADAPPECTNSGAFTLYVSELQPPASCNIINGSEVCTMNPNAVFVQQPVTEEQCFAPVAS